MRKKIIIIISLICLVVVLLTITYIHEYSFTGRIISVSNGNILMSVTNGKGIVLSGDEVIVYTSKASKYSNGEKLFIICGSGMEDSDPPRIDGILIFRKSQSH